MKCYLGRFSDRIYGVVRIVVGFLFACHGADKLFPVFGGPPAQMTPLVWASGLIELVGGGLICLGILTGWAAFICSGQMAVAYFMVHQPRGLFPIENGGERAALYSWIFLYIAAKGAGPWSLGSLVGGARAR